MKLRVCFVIVSFLAAIVGSVLAQTAAYQPTPASTQVPRLIKFSGVAKDDSGKPITGVVGIQFSLYKDQQAGAPLWIETQNIQADAAGHYTALLGSASADGVPLELFSSGEAQWLGVHIQGQPERPRVLLVSVPYALKAHEAETLAGRSISDFVLQSGDKAGAVITSRAGVNQGGAKTVGATTPPPPAGPTTFTGSNTTQIVGVTQSGTGVGLSATATTHAAVAGTITGPTNTGVFGLASNTSAGSNAAGVTGQSNTQLGPGVQGVTTTSGGIGVQGVALATSGGVAVQGLNKATSGAAYGVSGSEASTAAGSAGVIGSANGASGVVFGVQGQTNSATTNAAGVNGFEGAATGQVFGVNGSTNSKTNFAAGVNGFAGATTGNVFGVAGSTNSTGTNAAGVSGFEGATTGVVFGVTGDTNSTTANAAGVNGFEGAATGVVFGVAGDTNSTTANAAGVNGFEGATKGRVFGVTGSTNSTTNFAAGVSGFEGAATGIVNGVSGSSTSATQGASGVSGFEASTTGLVSGVTGVTNSTTTGAAGVTGGEGAATGLVIGVSGSTSSTTNGASGVAGGEGALTGAVFGVSGTTSSTTNGAVGVSGFEGATTGGVAGVAGTTTSTNGTGVVGSNLATSGPALGVSGTTKSPNGAGGVFTNLSGGTSPVIAANGAGFAQIFIVDASGNGSFSGNLNVKGKLTKGSGSFKIDHPLDPANKYLSHSFVESPDMMNVYNGNVTTDRHGLAIVTLPDYFEALNQDFRYQLTVMGKFAQAIVANKIAANRFVIRTSKPNVEVSWQVTGIRQDAYANAYRIPVEEDKPPQEQGRYLHPELFGASPEQAVGYNAPTPQAEIARAPSLAVSPAPPQ